jgi:hypothetical protein
MQLNDLLVLQIFLCFISILINTDTELVDGLTNEPLCECAHCEISCSALRTNAID